MKSLFLSPSLSRDAGGIYEIEKCLAHALSAKGIEIEALGLYDSNWLKDKDKWPPVKASVVPVRGPKSFGYAPGLASKLAATPYDLLHLHSLWMYPSIAASQATRRFQKPLIVTPNGMLEPWALRNSLLKKKLAGYLYENRMLRKSTCIQANTEKELRDIRAYGLRNPICVIPNGVDLPKDSLQDTEKSSVNLENVAEELTGITEYNTTHIRRILLFLGRLHPKKGLMNALRAWASHQNCKSHEWQFVIAGWDQAGHEADLKRLCADLGLSYSDIPASAFVGETPTLLESSYGKFVAQKSSSVIFTGPAFGATKDQLLRRASAFILPSFSEGLPMSVLEAWAYRLPVLMTDHCNLSEGFMSDAALRIGTDVVSIAAGMHDLLRSPASDLQSMGHKGRALVERQFTWQQVAAKMMDVYEWALGGGNAPECIEK